MREGETESGPGDREVVDAVLLLLLRVPLTCSEGRLPFKRRPW